MRLLKGIFNKVDQLLTGRRPVDDELFDELEELLIQADLSIHTTTKLVDALRKDSLGTSEQIKDKLKGHLQDILLADSQIGLVESPQNPTVILFVGVNGVGKTTTIAKVANRYKKKGKRVLMTAADTFRDHRDLHLSLRRQRLMCIIDR